MTPSSIIITYKSKKHVLNRTENQHYPIVFESDRWSIRIYILQDGRLRILIDKSVRKSKTEKHLQFCYDCYCSLFNDNIILNYVSDPATCKRIRNNTKWFTIEPIIGEIYTQLKSEIDILHPFDMITNIGDLQYFMFHKMKEYGTVEYTVNNSLRFGIGENAYTTSEEAMQAKEKEPVMLLNMFDGHHIVSTDSIIFFLYWLQDRDGKLTVSDGNRAKSLT